MSSTFKMEVIFQSFEASDNKGFSANYRFLTDYGIQTGLQSGSDCNFLFNSSNAISGSFTSPNYPGLYPRNTICHYQFFGKPKDIVTITFPFFDVEGIPPGCSATTQSDYLQISNVDGKLIDKKLKRICGQKEDGIKDLVSKGNFFRVSFISNDVFDSTGFKAIYQFKSTMDIVEATEKKKQKHDFSNSFAIFPSFMMPIYSVLFLSLYS